MERDAMRVREMTSQEAFRDFIRSREKFHGAHQRLLGSSRARNTLSGDEKLELDALEKEYDIARFAYYDLAEACNRSRVSGNEDLWHAIEEYVEKCSIGENETMSSYQRADICKAGADLCDAIDMFKGAK